MNVFQEAFYNAFKELKAFRVMVYIIWGIVIIGGIIVFGFNSNIEPVEFVPYSAKVISYYTESYQRGGVYYQRIEFDNGKRMSANGFINKENVGKPKSLYQIFFR